MSERETRAGLAARVHEGRHAGGHGRALLAEALGTGCLVVAGTGAIVVNQLTGGGVSHVGVALVFGLVVLVLIVALGEVSGAHFNPAVTLGLACTGRCAWRAVPWYIAAQLAGAFAGSGVIALLFPSHETLGATLPLGSVRQAIVMEVLITFALMLVVLAVSRGLKDKGSDGGVADARTAGGGNVGAAIAVGGVVCCGALWAGPITGASMNPARSIALAVVAGQTQHLWVYCVAPVVGAALAVVCGRGLWSRRVVTQVHDAHS